MLAIITETFPRVKWSKKTQFSTVLMSILLNNNNKNNNNSNKMEGLYIVFSRSKINKKVTIKLEGKIELWFKKRSLSTRVLEGRVRRV